MTRLVSLLCTLLCSGPLVAGVWYSSAVIQNARLWPCSLLMHNGDRLIALTPTTGVDSGRVVWYWARTLTDVPIRYPKQIPGLRAVSEIVDYNGNGLPDLLGADKLNRKLVVLDVFTDRQKSLTVDPNEDRFLFGHPGRALVDLDQDGVLDEVTYSEGRGVVRYGDAAASFKQQTRFDIRWSTSSDSSIPVAMCLQGEYLVVLAQVASVGLFKCEFSHQQFNGRPDTLTGSSELVFYLGEQPISDPVWVEDSLVGFLSFRTIGRQMIRPVSHGDRESSRGKISQFLTLNPDQLFDRSGYRWTTSQVRQVNARESYAKIERVPRTPEGEDTASIESVVFALRDSAQSFSADILGNAVPSVGSADRAVATAVNAQHDLDGDRIPDLILEHRVTDPLDDQNQMFWVSVYLSSHLRTSDVTPPTTPLEESCFKAGTIVTFYDLLGQVIARTTANDAGARQFQSVVDHVHGPVWAVAGTCIQRVR